MNLLLRPSLIGLFATSMLLAAACGSPSDTGDAARDATTGLDVSGADARADAPPGMDTGLDAGRDTGSDAGLDAAREASADATGADTTPGSDASTDADGDTGPAPDTGPATCLDNIECGPRAYCASMMCAGRGTCVARPLSCTTVFDPVCGCDGVTYANACGAASAGARVASTGACGGADAGARGCTTNADCGRTEYCAAGTCDGAGVCTARPTACPDVVDPVCGCDGMDYGNSCEAAAAGVRVSTPGRCVGMPPGDGGTSFCATVRCLPGTVCCESMRACVAIGGRCPCAAPCAAGTVCCEGASIRGAGTCYDPRCLSCCM